MGPIVLGAGGHARVVLDVLRACGADAPLLLDDDTARWGTRLDGTPTTGPVSALRQLLPPGVREGFVAVGSNTARRALSQLLGGCGLGARVGCGVIVNTGAQVDHDCAIGDFVHLGPGSVLCGGVTVGPLSLVGAGANVAPGVSIGGGVVVGVGAAVIRAVADGAVVVGVPARVLSAVPALREGGYAG